MTKVYRDAAGALINIGEWDLQISKDDRNPVPAQVSPAAANDQLIWLDAGGNIVQVGDWPHDWVDVITNPIPAGAVATDEEVVTGWDGGKYLATDPRRLTPQ